MKPGIKISLLLLLMNGVLNADERSRLVGTAVFSPFRGLDNGKLSGIDYEIVDAVFKDMNQNVKYKIAPWKRTYRSGVSGDIPVIFSFTINKERRKNFIFSDPINSVTDVFFKRKDNNIKWETYKDLSKYKIGFSSGYQYAADFMHGVQNKLFEVDPIHGDAPEFRNLEKLVKKRIDLFICEVSVCSDIIKKNPEKCKDI